MLRFIVDTQLPPVLAKFFRDAGHIASHTSYYPNGPEMSDAKILSIATTENRIVVTKDSDFWDNYFVHGAPPRVLFLDIGNIKNKDLIVVVSKGFINIIKEFEAGAKLVALSKGALTSY